MSKFAGLFSIIFVVIFLHCAVLFGQTADVLEQINQLYSTKQYAQAAAAYQNLLAKTTDAPTKAKILFNLGLTYQQLKQYDKAIENFRQIFEMKVDDREAGGNIMQAYRNYRPNAQWEIGNSFFAKGDYENALLAYRTTREKYPFRSWCGTCQGSFESRYVLYEAICLEYLGRYDEAVKLYLTIYEPRLAEIFYQAGQIEDLKAIIAKRDEVYIADGMRKYAWTREKASEGLPSHYLNDAIKIYDLEKSENWVGLIKSAVRFAPLRRNGRRNAAAEILARHPQKVLPLIKNDLNNPTDRTRIFLYYEVLGLTGTNESIAILKELAAKELNWWHVAELVKALGAAGDKGERALKELEPNAKDNLKLAIERNKTGELDAESVNEIKFPTRAVNGRLPTNL